MGSDGLHLRLAGEAILIARRALGDTGLEVSELGLGGAALGNLYAPVEDEDARLTVAAALEGGVNFVDVAPFYGMGLAERRVGDALRMRETVISTKVGRLLDPLSSAPGMVERHGFVTTLPFEPRFDYTREGILRSHEDSLQRLGLGRIDLLLIHDIGSSTHGAEAARRMAELTEGGGLDALAMLKRQGIIAGWGLGVNEIAVCLEILNHARPDAILLAGRYSLLDQEALERLFPAAAARSVPIIVGGPFNSGLLAGTPRFDYAPPPAAIRDKAKRLDAICTHHGVPLPAAALQFILAHPQVATTVPGARSADEVRANIGFLDVAIPSALWHDLADNGLVSADAPLPA
jgi:D-threo-aldose 1-dehydrogenase